MACDQVQKQIACYVGLKHAGCTTGVCRRRQTGNTAECRPLPREPGTTKHRREAQHPAAADSPARRLGIPVPAAAPWAHAPRRHTKRQAKRHACPDPCRRALTIASTICCTELICITFGGCLTSHHFFPPGSRAATRSGACCLRQQPTRRWAVVSGGGRQQRWRLRRLPGACDQGTLSRLSSCCVVPLDPHTAHPTHRELGRAATRGAGATSGVPRCSCDPLERR